MLLLLLFYVDGRCIKLPVHQYDMLILCGTTRLNAARRRSVIEIVNPTVFVLLHVVPARRRRVRPPPAATPRRPSPVWALREKNQRRVDEGSIN